MKKTSLLLFLLVSTLVHGQDKKKLDHTVYDSWNSISDVKQSKSGSIVTYEINPLTGDGDLHIEALNLEKEKAFNRGKNASINYNENFVVFLIKPEADTIRQLKLDEVKESKHPKDTLAIYWPESDSLFTVPRVKSFQLAEEGDWVAYLSQDDERPDCPEKKKCRLFKKKNPCVKGKTSGTTLHLINPANSSEITIDRVVDYKINKTGEFLIYTVSDKGDSDTLELHYLNLLTLNDKVLISGQLKISKLKFDYDNEQLVFLHSIDTNKRKSYSLSYWNEGMETAELLIDSTTSGMPEGYNISVHSTPYFSKDGTRLFVGTNLLVEQDPEDTLLDSEKAKVDVWSGFDLKIQPQQLLNKKQDERKAHRAIYDFASKKLIQIGDETIESIRTIDQGNGAVALGMDSKPYQKAMTWDFPWKRDVYLIDFTSGDRKLLKEGITYGFTLSPSGDYLVWYNGPDSSWYCKSVNGGNDINLTGNFDALFASDVNGSPYIPFSEGNNGWAKIDGVEYMIVNSRYDVWAICPSDPNKSFSLTNGAGKSENIIYRHTRFDYDSTYTIIENGLIHAIDFETKAESYHSITLAEKTGKLNELIHSDHKFVYISKADETDRVLFRRMSFLDYPEIESTDLSFKNPVKLSLTNPQQADYNWGTVEMVEWISFEERSLKGLLYKPEDFDSTKSYPMIVYFYEKYSSDIHAHYVPKPTASIIYPTEYVSNGYIIFIPDIEYTPGHPAASAYDCIVSGTDYLTQKHSWIDTNRMGLQGQSWGGYQTAQLVTMTTKYKAAMAGAPVSNMFSAYGGVRWGSGLSRMFQYERTQSRIGYTIWEKPELYIENSPIFGLPNVRTPLLIMHNDGDGAVPWYQGIELYMGLRRLNQPVWLLNYNGDAHNLMQTANRKDLSIRMRQFFDYYLLDAEIPEWMEDGVPAINKGKNYGLELKKNE